MEPQNDNQAVDGSDAGVRKFGPVMKLYIWSCGVVEEILQKCPKKDHDCIAALGRVLLGSLVWTALILSLVSYRLFAEAGEIRPDLVAGSVALAWQILNLDSLVFFRSGFEIVGIAGLLRGGLDVGGGPRPLERFVFVGVRILLSVGMAQLLALFTGIIVFQSDIDDRLQSTFDKANARVIVDATKIVDADIQRATDAMKSQASRVDQLSKQTSQLREHDIEGASGPQIQEAEQELNRLSEEKTKADDAVVTAQNFAAMERGGIKIAPGNSGIAGAGPRYKAAMEAVENAKQHVQEVAASLEAARVRLDELRKELASTNKEEQQRSHSELPGYEATLTSEEAKLTNLKGQLDGLIKGREDAIRRGVESAPTYVPLNKGILAQLRAIEELSSEDHIIATVIWLVDLVSMALDMAGVIAKATSYLPMEYCDRLARISYATDVRMVDELMAELNRAPATANDITFPPPPPPANDNERNGASSSGSDPFSDLDNSPPQPPKRPRGRPRKHPIHNRPIKSARRKTG
jgi:uncharacterized protein DUF4407